MRYGVISYEFAFKIMVLNEGQYYIRKTLLKA